MFSHIMIGSNDIARSKAFYDTVLATVGAGAGMENVAKSGHKRVFYRHAGSSFGISQPINNEPASFANGATIGFKCESAEQVKLFHDTAVAAGGTSIEGAPGLREGAMGAMHLSYVRDPDGNKLCAVYRVV